MAIVLALFVGLLPMIPAFVFLRRRSVAVTQSSYRMAWVLGGINVLIGLIILGVGLVWLLAPQWVEAAGLAEAAAADPYRPLSAAIAVSVGSISAGYAVSTTGSAAVGAIAERPEVFGRALIFVGLAEGVAIYGLIIAFIILGG